MTRINREMVQIFWFSAAISSAPKQQLQSHQFCFSIEGDSARPRMGTREVYEEKLRSGNLHHDPTMNPGLGSPRCPRCLSLLDHDSDKGKGEWTITPVLHDATGVAGFGIGGMLGAIHGFNMGIPYLQNCLKGPNWHPFLLGFPPLLLFSGASAAFGGYALTKFAQLTMTSYYVTSSASHYGISLLTRHIEETRTSRSQQIRLR